MNIEIIQILVMILLFRGYQNQDTIHLHLGMISHQQGMVDHCLAMMQLLHAMTLLCIDYLNIDMIYKDLVIHHKLCKEDTVSLKGD